MLSFLKVFARGIICTILLPLILVVWVLYAVYCLIVFFVMLIKSIILFFAGDNAAGEMKEDIEAKKILLEAEQRQVEQAQVMNMMYQNMAAQQQMMQQQMTQQVTQPINPEPAKAEFNPFGVDPIEQNQLNPETSAEEANQPTEGDINND